MILPTRVKRSDWSQCFDYLASDAPAEEGRSMCDEAAPRSIFILEALATLVPGRAGSLGRVAAKNRVRSSLGRGPKGGASLLSLHSGRGREGWCVVRVPRSHSCRNNRRHDRARTSMLCGMRALAVVIRSWGRPYEIEGDRGVRVRHGLQTRPKGAREERMGRDEDALIHSTSQVSFEA